MFKKVIRYIASKSYVGFMLLVTLSLPIVFFLEGLNGLREYLREFKESKYHTYAGWKKEFNES